MPIETAMILAAGKGERMRPLTDHTPKPLLEVVGKPLIVHHIEKLVQAGVKHIVINLFWLGEQIPARLGNGDSFGVDIDYITESELLETAGGITNALALLTKNGAEPFWVVNGDVWCDVDFSEAADTALSILSQQDSAALMMVNNPAHHPLGDFPVTEQRLMAAEQSPHSPRFTYSGVGVYRPQMFTALQAKPLPLRPVLDDLVAQNKLAAWVYQGQWQDVGTPQRLAELNQELAS
ncbi:N-acetylmuramate alpha-1-phosphate uridylyltransferase MurU [Alteromonas sp. a30]|uniref:N-acetylmuramate alpha-1-phosphate uridylyltransferase MurU n=1 Tax=Alteromonas sp. a30 TaxID=2730917 RepID=UPI00227F21B1|nr:nucleotidyltransferase family protein [Alteromonas sp. a30]MCY7296196.1 nucleotidyltransferase family protein [Alteromonas sp. a30]